MCPVVSPAPDKRVRATALSAPQDNDYGTEPSWSLEDSNLRRLPCEGSALPLS